MVRSSCSRPERNTIEGKGREIAWDKRGEERTGIESAGLAFSLGSWTFFSLSGSGENEERTTAGRGLT